MSWGILRFTNHLPSDRLSRVSGLLPVTTRDGWNYLVCFFGSRRELTHQNSPEEKNESTGRNAVWTLQLPSSDLTDGLSGLHINEGTKRANFRDKIRAKLKDKTGSVVGAEIKDFVLEEAKVPLLEDPDGAVDADTDEFSLAETVVQVLEDPDGAVGADTDEFSLAETEVQVLKDPDGAVGTDTKAFAWVEADVQVKKGKFHPLPRVGFASDVIPNGKGVIIWCGNDGEVPGNPVQNIWLLRLAHV
ncbi:hypothetical protein EJ04DRAFT_76123 [Polyplosphaeria fusca]|uniref:Uncharacterized protein n=1 Tax=Polyplosphaeria fusca TaxID=682080 RepID=A0A9P4QKX8_9PLEO|nr:hypothetical protein EJ04DRAFT_76123 [Polyplosphaeria fusca]